MEVALVVASTSLFVLAMAFAFVLPGGSPSDSDEGGSEAEDDGTMVPLSAESPVGA